MENTELTEYDLKRIEFLKSKCEADFEKNSDSYKSWQAALKKEFGIDYSPESEKGKKEAKKK